MWFYLENIVSKNQMRTFFIGHIENLCLLILGLLIGGLLKNFLF